MRWRTGDKDKEKKKNMFLQSIPGIICAEQPERLRNSHTLLPLHETPTGRNNQSMRVNKPFSYQEIQRIKEDLGDYLEDPEKYIRGFTGVWPALWPYLERCDVYPGTNTKCDSKTWVLGKAVAYGGERLGNESVGKRKDEIAALPTGNQAVWIIESDWDYNTVKGRWDQSHFVRCVLEGFRQAGAKILNYAKLVKQNRKRRKLLVNSYIDWEKPFADSLRWIPKVKKEQWS